MDPKQEHAATLCAFGTLAVAATGLAFGTGEEVLLTRPGKRKSPGSDTAYTSSPSIPPPSRRVVSTPIEAVSTPDQRLPRSFSASFFRRKSPAVQEKSSLVVVQSEQPRASSATRDGSMPQRQAIAVEDEDVRPRSAWRKRLSTLSSLNGPSPAPSTYKFDMDTPSTTPHQSTPSSNRLVKRSTSQRVLSEDKSKFFRRPATSHQRSSSMMAIPQLEPPPTLREAYNQQEERPMSSASIWRPFFSSGYPRKRHTSSGHQDRGIRTVSTPYAQHATLVNARAINRQSLDNDRSAGEFSSSPVADQAPSRQRLKRSLNSIRRTGRQRYFTEPVTSVSRHNVHGSMVPPNRSPLSPVSRSSTFNIELPPGTPIFGSSPPPPLSQAPRANPSINKRISVAPSDPNTASSDNETKLFSDDDSMDFQSDTAYDSLATRATVSSQSGYRQPKIETIFDETTSMENNAQMQTLEALMQRSTLNNRASGNTSAWNENVGIGIRGWDDDDDDIKMNVDEPQTLTPVREQPSIYGSVEELNATPMALRRAIPTIIGSSPPSSITRRPIGTPITPGLSQHMEIDDEDSIDWSPKSDSNSRMEPILPSNSPIIRRNARLLDSALESESKRSSIFDWSENQKSQADTNGGIGPRPKTVHGKQGNEQARSRAAGRKGANALHLRSQSVPVNRDSAADLEVPLPNAKFGTWGLGHKPVSEEWSDDFEFEEGEDDNMPLQISSGNQMPGPRDSVRSVKVPQAIMDRQQSVHQQFNQVQEFMTLVEELKRLRAQGAFHGLLESQSRQLWEDAENIINLATLNDEDEPPVRPSSPTSSDIFGDELQPDSRRMSVEDSKRDSFNLRSFSGPATPPSATRPRGESLAQAKSFLQTIHQKRGANELSPPQQRAQREKLPFDTQDLRDLVTKAGVITRALKDLVRRAEGVNVSPDRTPQKQVTPTFSQIFNPPNSSPGLRKPGLPKSKSANSYLSEAVGENEIPLKFTMIEV